MFNFLFIRVPIGKTVRNLTTQLGSLLNPWSHRSISSKAYKNQNPFVVSYLISSCGLSPAGAISASKKISFESTQRPDSVLTFFRNQGFPESQISRFIRLCPSLLLVCPSKILVPKLDFFHSFGVSRPNIVKIVCRSPVLLSSSLKNKIIPALNFLKSLVGTVENVVIVLKREGRFITSDTQNVSRNIALLRENGVVDTNILTLVMCFPSALTRKSNLFKDMIEDIRQLGIEPSKYVFLVALHAFTSMNKSTWKQKLEAYQKWGFSENEILMAFRKYPWFMKLSERKIMGHMDFFVNKMGWEQAVILKCPHILGHSLEKRILPRCSVFRVLILKGLVKEEDTRMVSKLKQAEKQFVENFLAKYKEEIPQLSNFYKGNITLLELGYEADQLWKEPIVEGLSGSVASIGDRSARFVVGV